MATDPIAGGRTADATPAWPEVMVVVEAAYELGLSGDPAGAVGRAQAGRRLRLVDACEACTTALRALVPEGTVRVDAADLRHVLEELYEDTAVYGPETEAAYDRLLDAARAGRDVVDGSDAPEWCMLFSAADESGMQVNDMYVCFDPEGFRTLGDLCYRTADRMEREGTR